MHHAVEVQTRKHEASVADKKKSMENLLKRKEEIVERYAGRVAELRERAVHIRDLIERAKAEADVGLHDILSKWEIANDRILLKYPEGAQIVLEEDPTDDGVTLK